MRQRWARGKPKAIEDLGDRRLLGDRGDDKEGSHRPHGLCRILSVRERQPFLPPQSATSTPLRTLRTCVENPSGRVDGGREHVDDGRGRTGRGLRGASMGVRDTSIGVGGASIGPSRHVAVGFWSSQPFEGPTGAGSSTSSPEIFRCASPISAAKRRPVPPALRLLQLGRRVAHPSTSPGSQRGASIRLSTRCFHQARRCGCGSRSPTARTSADRRGRCLTLHIGNPTRERARVLGNSRERRQGNHGGTLSLPGGITPSS